MEAFRLIKTQHKKDGISSFSAVSAILGGNLGTGNISGVAVALMTGGPGAIFWMWVMAILASIFKFSGCYLGVKYRQKDSTGEYVGGPMYYLEKGLKSPFLAKLFCCFTIFSALTVGNMVQIQSLSLPIKAIGINPLFLGIPMALLVGGVIMGGLQRFANTVSFIVPFMAGIYLIACLILISLYSHDILPALKLILQAAFGFESAFGGALGFTIFQMIRSGFDRGLFATDSGLGLAPIIHSAVTDTHEIYDNKIVQAIISILSPLIVMVVCTMTAVVLIVTGAWQISDIESTNMCIKAFQIGFGSHWAGQIVTITLFFFAFTTILTWSFCADKSVEYLFGVSKIRIFQIIFILFIPVGVFFKSETIWGIADISINLMFLINVIGVIGLSKFVIKDVRKLKHM